jgi:PIN domain nuclease of toxin-antitoxin system
VTYLLDTHVWLWLLAEPERIRSDLLAELRDGRTRLLLSAASAWEMAIKWGLGRLTLPEPPDMYVPARMARTNVEALAVTHAHALQVALLPAIHRDPFDRLLVAQAQVERVPLVTVDPILGSYDVEVRTA